MPPLEVCRILCKSTARLVCQLSADVTFQDPYPHMPVEGVLRVMFVTVFRPGRTHFAELLRMLVCNVAENGRKPGEKRNSVLYSILLYSWPSSRTYGTNLVGTFLEIRYFLPLNSGGFPIREAWF